jgi:hypothetical protein
MISTRFSVQKLFQKKLLELRGIKNEVSKFKDSLSPGGLFVIGTGHRTLETPGLCVIGTGHRTLETPIILADMWIFGTDIDSEVLDDFGGSVTHFIIQAVNDEQRESLFKNRTPRSVIELINQWGLEWAREFDKIATCYWECMVTAALEGRRFSSLFTRQAVVPMGFSDAFPDIFTTKQHAQQLEDPSQLSPMKTASHDGPYQLQDYTPDIYPALRPDELDAYSQTLNYGKRKWWNKAEKDRVQQHTLLLEIPDTDKYDVRRMERSHKWQRTIEMRALSGIYMDGT